jgi:hypothetical protein
MAPTHLPDIHATQRHLTLAKKERDRKDGKHDSSRTYSFPRTDRAANVLVAAAGAAADPRRKQLPPLPPIDPSTSSEIAHAMAVTQIDEALLRQVGAHSQTFQEELQEEQEECSSMFASVGQMNSKGQDGGVHADRVINPATHMRADLKHSDWTCGGCG